MDATLDELMIEKGLIKDVDLVKAENVKPLSECSLIELLHVFDIYGKEFPKSVGVYEEWSRTLFNVDGTAFATCPTKVKVEKVKVEKTVLKHLKIDVFSIQVESEAPQGWKGDSVITVDAVAVSADEFFSRLERDYNFTYNHIKDLRPILGNIYENYPNREYDLVKAFFGEYYEGFESALRGFLTSKSNLPLRLYITAEKALAVLAFVSLYREGDLKKVKIPEAGCGIGLTDTESATVIYYGDTRNYTLPLEGSKVNKRIRDKVNALSRLHQRIKSIAEDLNDKPGIIDQTYMRIRGHKGSIKRYLLCDKGEVIRDYELEAEYNQKREDVIMVCEEVLDIYIELTKWVAPFKETVLKDCRAAVKAKESFEAKKKETETYKDVMHKMPNNMHGLPAHFAAVTKGVELAITRTQDRKRIEVERPVLGKKEVWSGYALENNDGSLYENNQFSELAGFANIGRGLFGQGLIATTMLYQANGGYNKENQTVRIDYADWVDTMRPAQVQGFKKSGRSQAFGKALNPKEVFRLLIKYLVSIRFKNEKLEKLEEDGFINGFFLCPQDNLEADTPWADLMLNENLYRLLVKGPHMITNTKALFEYGPQQLDYMPSSQLAIEQWAHVNLINKKGSELVTSGGHGITREKLADKLGLLRGPHDRLAHIIKQEDKILDGLGNAGILEDWRIDEKEKKGAKNAFEKEKIIITMDPVYRTHYDLPKTEKALAHATKRLENPFS